ncbi:MAG: ABC transporter ATP-binding protein [Clostridia bacterium]
MRTKRKILELRDVYKTYYLGDVPTHALNGVNLEVYHGEIIVILGSSGSGKTTLLNVLSGLDRPTSGDIFFDDENIAKYSESKITKFRKNNLGFIFQTYNLLEHLNVKENIKVGSNLGKNNINIDKLIETVGLTKHTSKYMHQLSGGEQQRVSIARALAKNPKIMFADEPTGALDEVTGKKVLEALIDANMQYHTTMIIVTHNPGIALIGDRIIRVNSGQISSIEENEERVNPLDIPWG